MTEHAYREMAWKKLSVEDRRRAVEILELLDDELDVVAEAFAKYDYDWDIHEPFTTTFEVDGIEIADYWHFGGGMYVRNLLREHGFTDDQLPPFDEFYGEGTDVRNWDDYYIACVEAAAGVRPIEDE